MRKFYTNIKKDYYLKKVSEYLAEVGRYIGCDEFNLWMGMYRRYVDKAIELIEN